MRYKFTIKGTLPGLNELIEAERRNRYEGARMKKQCETVVAHSARQLGNVVFTKPVHKVIQDALVKAGYLLNDGWDNIEGFEDHFYVDAKQPRIVVEIWEGEDESFNCL